MVQQKKAGSADTMNGSGKRGQSNMTFSRGNANNAKSHNGMVAREHLRLNDRVTNNL